MRRLLVLLAGLPAESMTRAELGDYDRDDGLWTTQRELAAQTLEVLSIMATQEHRLRKPLTWARPGSSKPATTRQPDAMRPGDAARALLAQRAARVGR